VRANRQCGGEIGDSQLAGLIGGFPEVPGEADSTAFSGFPIHLMAGDRLTPSAMLPRGAHYGEIEKPGDFLQFSIAEFGF